LKKAIAIALLVVLALSVIPAASAETSVTVNSSVVTSTTVSAKPAVHIRVDGDAITFPDAQPFIDENGRTQVPIGALAEELGIRTSWDGSTSTATLMVMKDTMHGDYVRIIIGKSEIETGTFNGLTGIGFFPEATIEMDTAALLKDDRTFIPVRYVAESLGFVVEWDEASNSVDLTRPTQSSFESELLQYMPTDKNYMISPFSLKMALALTANGADGDTQSEILSVLGIGALDEFNKSAKGFIANANSNEAVEFNIANSIWHNSDYYGDPELGFSDAYKSTVKDYYHGIAEEIRNNNGADIINNWISTETKGKITNAISDNMVRECLSFLVNTIYFKGDWASPFAAESTAKRVFTDRSGTEKTTDFMYNSGYYNYYEDGNIAMLAKPYKDGNIRMYFVLPNPAKSAQKVHYIEPYMLTDAVNNMEHVRVNFSVPKFKTEYLHSNLIDILGKMGIQTAFNPNMADFLGMYSKKPKENVFISMILQKTFIEVDEKGTEAAAATVIGMAGGSAPPAKIIDFICDRPFTYFIRNDATGDILFMGEYAFVE